jgi:ABC-type multidrug transport system fused ATPase/permease subunit
VWGGSQEMAAPEVTNRHLIRRLGQAAWKQKWLWGLVAVLAGGEALGVGYLAAAVSQIVTMSSSEVALHLMAGLGTKFVCDSVNSRVSARAVRNMHRSLRAETMEPLRNAPVNEVNVTDEELTAGLASEPAKFDQLLCNVPRNIMSGLAEAVLGTVVSLLGAGAILGQVWPLMAGAVVTTLSGTALGLMHIKVQLNVAKRARDAATALDLSVRRAHVSEREYLQTQAGIDPLGSFESADEKSLEAQAAVFNSGLRSAKSVDAMSLLGTVLPLLLNALLRLDLSKAALVATTALNVKLGESAMNVNRQLRQAPNLLASFQVMEKVRVAAVEALTRRASEADAESTQTHEPVLTVNESTGIDVGMPRTIVYKNVSIDIGVDEHGYPSSCRLDFELRVKDGRELAVLGPSGAGKTRGFAKVLMGLSDPDGGHIYINNKDIRLVDRAKLMRHIGWAPQDARMTTYTLGEAINTLGLEDHTDEIVRMLFNLRVRVRHQPGEKTTSMHDPLTVVGPTQIYRERLLDQRIGDMSGGEKSRVMLAFAKVRKPRILIADEPTSGLDDGAGRLAVELARASGAFLIHINHHLGTRPGGSELIVLGGVGGDMRVKQHFAPYAQVQTSSSWSGGDPGDPLAKLTFNHAALPIDNQYRDLNPALRILTPYGFRFSKLVLNSRVTESNLPDLLEPVYHPNGREPERCFTVDQALDRLRSAPPFKGQHEVVSALTDLKHLQHQTLGSRSAILVATGLPKSPAVDFLIDPSLGQRL